MDRGNNLLTDVPPGTGKTMLAKRVPSILPLMSFEEALETTKIHSIAGALTFKPNTFPKPFNTGTLTGSSGFNIRRKIQVEKIKRCW
jgi:magnesium chelatase family protein